MMKLSARTWLLIAAALLVVVVTAILVAVPVAVRHLAVQRLEDMTGRPVTIRDVDVNLFTRRVVFHELAIRQADEGAPLAAAPRIEARLRLQPLVGGRMHLDELVLVEPAVFVSRDAEGHVSVEDVVEAWQARQTGEPAQIVLERLRVDRGRITFADYAVDPDRRWLVENIGIEAYEIATTADAAAGRLSARFVAAGAPAAIEVEDLHVRPLRLRASMRVDGLDVAPFAAYAGAGAPVWIAQGRFSGQALVEYDANGFFRASGENSVTDLVMARAGQEAPFVRVPDVRLAARDVTFTDRLAAGELSVAADEAVVFDATAARPAPQVLRDVRFHYQDQALSVAGPGDVRLTATLPGDATLDARGTGEIVPPRTDVRVEVRALDIALARMWLPPDSAITPSGGEIGATLDVRYAQATGLTVGGQAWVEQLALSRPGDREPFLRDERVDVTARDLRVDDAGFTAGRLELAASPTVLVREGSDPLDVSSVRITASGGGGRDDAPTHVDARIELPRGGVVTADGTARLGAATARFTVVAKDLDAMLAAPYFPADAPLTISNGRLDATLAAAWSGALGVDGDVTIRRLTIQRAGQDEPLVEHATLQVALDRLRADASGTTLAEVRITGAPVIVDATASPPERFELRELALTARDLTWPVRQPITLEGHAEAAEGGRAMLQGSLHPGTLATDVRMDFEDVALTRVEGYLAADTPVAIESGRAEGAARLRYAGSGPIRVDSDGALVDVAITLTNSGTVITDDRITFSIDDLVVADGGVRIGAAIVDASPAVGRGGETAAPFDVHAEVRKLAWPGDVPADLVLTAMPGGGRLDVRGTFTPSTRAMEGTVTVSNAALAPFTAFVPIEAPVDGRVTADAKFAVHPGAAAPLVARGDVTVRELRIGPEDTAPIRAGELRVEGLAVEGRRVEAARVGVDRLSVLVEREDDGSFPLRAMLTPEAAGAASPNGRREAAAREEPRDEDAPWQFTVEEIVVNDGTVRFLDRTTTPFYSEEATGLSIRIADLTNVGDQRAGVMVQGIMGADAALDLRGEMAPFAEPFFLEVSGELRNFAVPRTNPYLQRFLDWIARRGELTTQVQYRVVGDQLQGTHDLLVHRLDVERARDGDRAERAVGVPLGLAVALLKDARGNIRFTLPVEGALGSPQFSFGDAIRSALTNVLGRLVTSPLRALGAVLRRDGADAGVAIDPVVFEPGSAALTPDAATQLQRVADVLRASPYVSLQLRGAASERDLQALRTRAVVARIQRVQREARMDDFAAAARQVWERSMPPGSEPPDDPQGIVRVLASREPVPAEEARALAERRQNVARTHLAEAAGIPRARLVDAPPPAAVGVEGAGRVEFVLEPSS